MIRIPQIFTAVLLLAPTLAWAEPSASSGWQVLAQEDGIVVSQRPTKGRKLQEFRGVVEIPADIFEAFAVVNDVTNHPLWMYQVSEAREVQRNSPLLSVLYTRLDIQWPVADRDSVTENEIRIVAPNHIRVEFRRTTRASVPEIKGVVRMPRLRGHYDLKALESGGTRVEYQVDADPGGGIPDWMTALTARDNPLNTLRKLREQVAETRGQYKEFIERWNPGQSQH
ncbi:MAG: hypothetical protein GY725_15940 [bacterium]|nr:hypothetical protein [bacterium]